jgi:pimeloyl-ACP methyl ester carboxylesterase
VFGAFKVLFLHGMSSDGGRKTAYLRSLGYDVLTPRLSDWSFRRAARTAHDAFNEFQPDVIVGSSRGGAVAMAMARSDVPLVLLAPAWRWCGVEPALWAEAIIIHSKYDKMVSVSDSRELCRRNPTARLLEVGTDHRLNDEEAGAVLAEVLDDLLPKQRGNCE